jgi:glycosyltransferase involved in cell wall biosynthesis
MSIPIKTISIIIPCFNEERTIDLLLEKVVAADTADLKKEVIVVDDGSTDRSREKITKSSHITKYILNENNMGKGASIQKAIQIASGDILLIQDADLEYSPGDYIHMIRPILNYDTSIVYGARRTKHLNRSPWSFAARVLFTYFVNLLYGSQLTDLNTCYKLFKREILNDITLDSKRFGFCSEVTIKSLLNGEKIIEVDIDYSPREKNEGKKISPLDGFPILFNIFYYRFFYRQKTQRPLDEV